LVCPWAREWFRLLFPR